MPRTANVDITRNALAAMVSNDGPMTRDELGLTHHYVRKMIADGDIAFATDKKTGEIVRQPVTDTTGAAQRGHPHNLFVATKNGRAKGRRVLAKATKDTVAKAGTDAKLTAELADVMSPAAA